MPSLWLTGAIGISVATVRLEIALILSVLTFFTLRTMASAKGPMDKDETKPSCSTYRDLDLPLDLKSAHPGTIWRIFLRKYAR